MTVEPYLTEEQLDTSVKPIIAEYLEHGNTTEVEVSSRKIYWFHLPVILFAIFSLSFKLGVAFQSRGRNVYICDVEKLC